MIRPTTVLYADPATEPRAWCTHPECILLVIQRTGSETPERDAPPARRVAWLGDPDPHTDSAVCAGHDTALGRAAALREARL